jgi:hypothetical protein
MRYLVGFIATVVVLFWWARNDHQARHEAANENLTAKEEPTAHPEPRHNERTPKTPPTSEPKASRPSAPPVAKAPPAEPEENPYHVDPFSKRKLDLPKPKSIADLLAKMTPYQPPMLPVTIPGRPPGGDGDVTTFFLGFYELSDGTLRRIQVRRYMNDIVRIQIEEVNGTNNEWSNETGDLKLGNFGNDQYSLVITFPDQRLLYLKFYSHTPLADIRNGLRTMNGWLLSKTRKISLRVAVADRYLVEYQNKGPGEITDWPSTETIKSMMPEPLR